MPKNIRDIIPSNRKSLKSISIPLRRVESPDDGASLESNIVPLRGKPRSKFSFPKKSLWLGVIIIALIAIFSIMALMNSATLTYKPKMSNLAFAGESYVAYKSSSGGELVYGVIKVSGDRSTVVPATGNETVSERAKGSVVIYNEQTIVQTLVKTTRLETAEGKIYRIQDNVTIPAKSNVEVAVVADVAGAEQNIGLSDFTLPGLKGTARFDKVYGRSKTAMTGGFVGSRKKASETDLARAKAELEKMLKADLIAKASAQVPADYILFSDLSNTNFSLLPTEAGTGDSAKVTEHADFNAMIFKRGDLAQYLTVAKLGANNVGAQVEIPDFSKLNIVISGNTAPDITKVSSVHIQVSGTATTRFLTDEVALASDLIGVSKANVDAVLKRYPSITSADSIVRPFWKSVFPTDATKIKIERQN